MEYKIAVHTDDFGKITVYVLLTNNQIYNLDSLKFCLEKEFGQCSYVIIDKGKSVEYSTNAYTTTDFVPDEVVERTLHC